MSWCSWLSRQSNTLKVSGSNPGDAIVRKNVCVAFGNSKLRNLFFSYSTFELKKKWIGPVTKFYELVPLFIFLFFLF